MTAPTTAPATPAADAAPEPRLRGPVRLLRQALPYVLALLLAFVVSGVVIAALGSDPIEAFRTILST
jgi:simple sugar transport system permease protein